MMNWEQIVNGWLATWPSIVSCLLLHASTSYSLLPCCLSETAKTQDHTYKMGKFHWYVCTGMGQ